MRNIESETVHVVRWLHPHRDTPLDYLDHVVDFWQLAGVERERWDKDEFYEYADDAELVFGELFSRPDAPDKQNFENNYGYSEPSIEYWCVRACGPLK